MKISLLQDETDNAPNHVEIDWPGVVTLLTTEFLRTDSKLGSLAWAPVEFIPPKRKKENARLVNAAVFDLDELTPAEFTDTLARIESSGHAAVVHTTFRHTPEKPKARAVFKLSRPVLNNEWPTVWAAIPRMLELKVNVDKQCSDASRLYYLPCARPDAPTFAATTDGQDAIDVDALLAYAHKQKFDVAVESKLASGVESAASIAPADEAAKARSGFVADDGTVNMHAVRAALRSMGAFDTKLLARRVLEGECLSEVGNAGGGWGRDSSLNKICSALGMGLPLEVPNEAILELLRPSVSQMEPPEEGQRFATWLEYADDMLTRARERKREKEAAEAAFRDNFRARQGFESAKTAPIVYPADGSAPVERDEAAGYLPYPETDLAQWAAEQGCGSVSEFDKRWVIQKDSVFYVFVEGQYAPPLTDRALPNSLIRDLARSGVSLTKQVEDKNGTFQERPRSAVDILADYSTVARHLSASLSLQKSHYDSKTQTFHEAVCPLRNLQPVNHPEIQRWLELVGGNDAEKLIDWVASVMRLDRQSCAVYIDGPKSAGKSLLAAGLARLWTIGGASELGRVLEGFNESLIQCPLIFADEALPQRKGITGELRRLTGATSRTLNRKFIPACSLAGAVRLIVAGNNERLLDTGEELSTNDLDAVALRFMYLKAPQAAADYLAALGGPPVVGKWIEEDKMAQHALWLRNARQLNEEGRFLVEGTGSEFHDRLATASGMAGLVCEWLVRYLAKKSTVGQKNNLLMIGEGELWVNTEALAGANAWEANLPSSKVPTAASIGRALGNLATGVIRVKLEDGTHLSYHRLKLQLVRSWADRLQIGDRDLIDSRINAPNPAIVAALAAQ